MPTISESGLPGFAAPGWVGVFAPARTPLAIAQKIQTAVETGFRDAKITETARTQGLDLATMAPREFTDFVAAERVKWGKVIREAKIKLD